MNTETLPGVMAGAVEETQLERSLEGKSCTTQSVWKRRESGRTARCETTPRDGEG